MRMLCARLCRLTPYALLLLAPYANAAWTLVQADAPATVIHESGRYQTDAGQRFALDDIVETPANGGVQIQDDAGNIAALGHDTRVLLMRDAHIALLSGWLKVLHACAGNMANCTAPVIETARTTFTPSDDTALVIAATTANYQSTDAHDIDAVFSESGTVSVLAISSSRGKAAPVTLDMHRFATHPVSSDTIAVTLRPDAAFVAAMPVTFRDALRVLPMPARLRNDPPNNLRPVVYDDISDWLGSGLAARRSPSTRFTARFRARLSDPAFHRAIVQHIHDLPDWRPLVFPPPQHAVIRSTAIQTRYANPTDPVLP
ncbi:hypothetical protein J8I87_11395 [Paraburkholderia sp. LEh10]|uniref:hypothetical protein n=1 Tax=Paraburkholderia sp. LEh10 TaxID=2821353 RepID=UPI001AE1A56D|nr:hypothetical protein [Paraburkholderia sp. LEh10]MBP0590304.1 hypothetical protein [Paraburkholderia sp. LEh10]